MTEWALFVVLFLALFTGWLLGSRRLTKSNKEELKQVPNDYFRGLNHLLKGQQSEAIDAFVDSLEVNSETFDIHLTLGNLFRKKGEIQKAINIHQSLLARPDLSSRDTRLVQLELASDFMSAGLLDRAERLLLNIASRKTEFQREILALLVDLYEFEQSWDKAIKISEQLQAEYPAKKQAQRLAHFHCEMAESAVKNEQWNVAFKEYKAAIDADLDCVRASIGLADVYMYQRRFRDAIKELKAVADQDHEFVPVIVPMLKQCYLKVWGGAGYIKFLQEQLKKYPSASLIRALTEHYAENDKEFAEQFIISQLRAHPTIKGFQELIDIQRADSSGPDQENLSVLYELIEQLTNSKPKYRCRQCGFAGHQLHWQCPSCKSWGSVKPIHGLEGE
ncbi:lipopolysaccharide assembly protein LapB [Marinomonas piezotolerans]|uniref:Lipopolysaccharide assembly protein B n=1 Tax=Marinomonas piezotolerans TaxID=2213058 RepID=A0A370U6M5_9GAMM|nr:lipopolysaccharide assembly protein LapB [Marinomonas piezotolerans]RDL43434.1 lipopolysaccharide assembly protein LapB [Marinomonas piezotolerans]